MDLLFIKFSNSTYYLEHEYVHNTARSQIFREYLCENELLSKTILACLSGAQMALIHEIKKCQQISWHCPFKLSIENLQRFEGIMS